VKSRYAALGFDDRDFLASPFDSTPINIVRSEIRPHVTGESL